MAQKVCCSNGFASFILALNLDCCVHVIIVKGKKAHFIVVEERNSSLSLFLRRATERKKIVYLVVAFCHGRLV